MQPSSIQMYPDATFAAVVNYEYIKLRECGEGTSDCKIVKFFHYHLGKVKENLEEAVGQENYKRYQNIEVVLLALSQINERTEYIIPLSGKDFFLQALSAEEAKKQVFAKLAAKLEESLAKHVNATLTLSYR